MENRYAPKWEEEWQTHCKSVWTHFLFPTIQSRLNLRDFVPSFWSTQGITGHGVFRDYLMKQARASDNTCPCGSGVEDAEKKELLNSRLNTHYVLYYYILYLFTMEICHLEQIEVPHEPVHSETEKSDDILKLINSMIF